MSDFERKVSKSLGFWNKTLETRRLFELLFAFKKSRFDSFHSVKAAIFVFFACFFNKQGFLSKFCSALSFELIFFNLSIFEIERFQRVRF